MPQSGSWAVNYANLQRMTKAQRLARARQQQRLARAAQYRAGYRTVARTRGVFGSGEMKYFDSSVSNNAIAAVTTSWTGTGQDPATLNTLFCPTVGAAINQRIGREVKVLKIKIRGYIRVDAQATQSTADAASYLRIILFQDTQTNAQQATGAQLIQDGSAAGTTVTAFQNLANTGRFRVLKDKVINLSNLNMANATGAANGVIQAALKRQFKIIHRFRKPVSVRFNATNGGSIADIVDNSFHIVVATDANAYAPTFNYACRVCYKE